MHLSVVERGHFVGLRGSRVVVSADGASLTECPLNRLKTLTIARDGVGLSSNLVTQCAARGIRLFFLDFRGQVAAALSGLDQHAVVGVRRGQFETLADDQRAAFLASAFARGKIHNQRSVLLYFAKYHRQAGDAHLRPAGARLHQATEEAKRATKAADNWRERLMGVEGAAASNYWAALARTSLLGEKFSGRHHRGADDVANQALNYGYAVLSSRVWSCISNAGLEPFAGFLHTERAGKPSLVLDVMEEYRPWVVDRSLAKLRRLLNSKDGLDTSLKRRLIAEIDGTLARRYPYQGKRVTLESIMQRQIYRLSGALIGERHYKPYLFRW
ncbi:MAG: CRISPR-associated endonuclease Cas1 [Thiohalorhabdus sp.]|uniref:CRISPR-associated endonuclease Cas1 n=1 Tax=Thiohalorhabdus sp. TaxID=3094134 RepID=UPI0039806D03